MEARKYNLKEFGLYKHTLKKKLNDLDRGDGDEWWSRCKALLERHTSMYTPDEITDLNGLTSLSHDTYALDHPEDHYPIEVVQAQRNKDKQNRIVRLLEILRQDDQEMADKEARRLRMMRAFFNVVPQEARQAAFDRIMDFRAQTPDEDVGEAPSPNWLFVVKRNDSGRITEVHQYCPLGVMNQELANKTVGDGVLEYDQRVPINGESELMTLLDLGVGLPLAPDTSAVARVLATGASWFISDVDHGRLNDPAKLADVMGVKYVAPDAGQQELEGVQ